MCAYLASGRPLQRIQMASVPEVGALRRKLLDAAVADMAGGAKATGVRWWLRFCCFGVGIRPVQHLESDATSWEKLQAETTLMDFVTWLVTCRPSGRPVSPRTARKYVGQVLAWMRRVHRADFCGGLDLVNLKDLVKGMRRELGDTPKRER